MKSGQYVKVKEDESLVLIAKRYNLLDTELLKANPGKKFEVGEWIFVPLKKNKSASRLPAQHLENTTVNVHNNGSEEFLNESDGEVTNVALPVNLEESAEEASHIQIPPEVPSSLSTDPQNMSFLWPLPSSYKISSPYGMRKMRKRKRGRFHEGIDISSPIGSHIIAIDDGIVIYSGSELKGYGNITVIAHRGGYFSVYAHSMKNFTRKSQKVYRGQVIALVGMTGRSTGPHLHFEIRRNSESYDPTIFLAK